MKLVVSWYVIFPKYPLQWTHSYGLQIWGTISIQSWTTLKYGERY